VYHHQALSSLSNTHPPGSYPVELFVWLCIQLVIKLLRLKHMNMLFLVVNMTFYCNYNLFSFVIKVCLVFTVTMITVKLLNCNGFYKTKCILFKVITVLVC